MASFHFLISYCCSPEEEISTFPVRCPPEEVVSCDEGTPQPSLLQAEETKWPQPLVWLSLETFHYLGHPPLDMLWYFVLLALRCPEVHTELQVWSRFLCGSTAPGLCRTGCWDSGHVITASAEGRWGWEAVAGHAACMADMSGFCLYKVIVIYSADMYVWQVCTALMPCNQGSTCLK